MKKIRLICINLIFYLFFVSSIDLILGRFFLRGDPPVSSVPNALWDIKIENDISHLYDANREIIIYERDLNGYRNYITQNNLILTIGGSTTDQRYVSEEYTWQYLINNQIKDKDISVINGGVPGQTLAGHLYSINNWHSKSLDNKKLKKLFSILVQMIFISLTGFGNNIRLF